MNQSFRRRLVAFVLVAVTTATVAAVPAPAAERDLSAALAPQEPVATSTPVLASARAQVQLLARANTARTGAEQEGVGSYDDPRSFFRTKRGVTLLVLAAAGIGYMWYSKVHDRIHSVARERLDQ